MSEQVNTNELDVEKLKAETAKLAQSNAAKQQSLIGATQGVPDLGIHALIKIEVFIETFLDEKAKVVFEHNFQQRLRHILEEDLKTLRQAQLTEGLPASQKLLLPKR